MVNTSNALVIRQASIASSHEERNTSAFGVVSRGSSFTQKSRSEQ
jgi:hypothetical protein